MTYVLDTNIITAILKENDKVKKRTQKALLEGKKFLINGVNYYEIKCVLLSKKATKQLKKFDLLYKEFGLILLDTQLIFDIATEIYANLMGRRKSINDADILIASVVISRNFLLVSNDADFNRIQKLKIENWLN